MPIFEFMCEECKKAFEELVRSASATDGVTCPACGSSYVKKKISIFASKVSGAGSGSYSLGSSSGASCSTGSV